MRKWLMGPVMIAGLVGAGLGVASFSALSAFAVTGTAAEKRAETFRQLELFAEIVAKAQSNYVTEFDEGEAIEAAIDGMLASLDPHSSYLDPDDFKDMQAQTSGEYGGLGIEVTAQDGFVKVVAPMDGTPASRAGVKSGDFLTAIDGKSIVGLPLNDAVKQMRGAVPRSDPAGSRQGQGHWRCRLCPHHHVQRADRQGARQGARPGPQGRQGRHQGPRARPARQPRRAFGLIDRSFLALPQWRRSRLHPRPP
jgi:hypothetical protein